MTTTSTTPVQDIPPLSRDEAMALAAAEYDRFLELLRSLGPDEWRRPTECEAWDVRAMATHLLAEAESHFSLRELVHQLRAYRSAKAGPMIDAMTALQVRDRADLTPDEIVARFEDAVPRSVRARRRMPGLVRRMRMKVDPPFEKERWPLSYLMDVIYTRDTWMHRGDISRATGRNIALTPEHDGRIVAHMVVEWAAVHAHAHGPRRWALRHRRRRREHRTRRGRVLPDRVRPGTRHWPPRHAGAVLMEPRAYEITDPYRCEGGAQRCVWRVLVQPVRREGRRTVDPTAVSAKNSTIEPLIMTKIRR
jgi:uncharacterized protein (TIGR03083 family)